MNYYIINPPTPHKKKTKFIILKNTNTENFSPSQKLSQIPTHPKQTLDTNSQTWYFHFNNLKKVLDISMLVL